MTTLTHSRIVIAFFFIFSTKIEIVAEQFYFFSLSILSMCHVIVVWQKFKEKLPLVLLLGHGFCIANLSLVEKTKKETLWSQSCENTEVFCFTYKATRWSNHTLWNTWRFFCKIHQIIVLLEIFVSNNNSLRASSLDKSFVGFLL